MYPKKRIKKYKRRSLEYYAKVGVPFELDFVRAKENLLIYRIKFVAGTTEGRIRQYLRDVAQMLKVQLFQLHRTGRDLFLIVAKDKMLDNRLLRIIANPQYPEHTKGMRIPFVIGYGVLEQPIIVDLPEYIHWLFGGSSNSGKTVGLKCLIISIICSCSPEDVNLILYDGASNLAQFDGVPHLSGDVMQDPESGFDAIMKLYEKMEWRIKLKREDIEEYDRQPFIVGVFDEFISLIASISDRNMAKQLTDKMSQLLRRGRHAKIHMVLAAQDPLIKDMKCDIGNASSRLGFTCTKPNYSMTILGESGAQNLSGDGEMYFKSNKHTGLVYIKGAYISSDEIDAVCKHICAKYEDGDWDDSRRFTLDDEGFGESELGAGAGTPVLTEQEIEDRLFAKIILWALQRETVSAQQIKTDFNMGWPRANMLLDRLNEIDIVDDPYGKQPRKVIPACVEDLPEDVIDFLESQGYTAEGGEPNLPE
ncbi:MAG: FtsK/SpoIIIE domain-containing protein [Defluviitaleaceae bacterium]|nr:FtsK/SpoIIIE domain-containing protein [Defluviitaleaceae bacterium]MCL2240624.1 FtsK/SpoIIIE domain-containing protein [Defluviitaleaceae bacterium]